MNIPIIKLRIYLTATLLGLTSACSSVPNTHVYSSPQAIPVPIRYVGPAQAGDSADPINGCRVYAFRLDTYIQTAILCPNGHVTTASAAHEDDDATTAAATSAAAVGAQ